MHATYLGLEGAAVASFSVPTAGADAVGFVAAAEPAFESIAPVLAELAVVEESSIVLAEILAILELELAAVALHASFESAGTLPCYYYWH